MRGAIIGLVLALSATSCDAVLKVSNPASLQEPALADPQLQQFLINGVIGEFQSAYGRYALLSGVLADELYMDRTDVNNRSFSRHSFDELNTVNADVYGSLQRARQSADDAADRVKTMLGVTATSSLDVARALIYGGYAYVLLGEGFCDAPVNGGPPLTSSELLTRGIARFEEGIAVATAGRSADDIAATNLISMAHVGAARALLQRGDLASARVHAALVPDGYERWAYYSSNSVAENNPVQLAVKSSGPFVGMQPGFQRLDDPRVPQPAATRTGVGGNPIFVPLKPSMYSGWSASGASVIDVATHIRFASGLEARYVAVETDGPGAAMLAFVNARRAAGGKPPASLTGAALVAELRAQRALDFYLTGHRLGDLRRYAASGTDLFPSGRFPIPPDVYGAMHCFIIPRSEKAGNPNF